MVANAPVCAHAGAPPMPRIRSARTSAATIFMTFSNVVPRPAEPDLCCEKRLRISPGRAEFKTSKFPVLGARLIIRRHPKDSCCVKKIGFLSFGHWTPAPYSDVRTASDALLQSIELAVAAEELG